MKCKSKRPQGLIYVPKRGAVLKQWGSTLKCFSISHVCTNPYAGIWVPTEHFLVVKGTCDIGLIKMKHMKSDPPFFLLCSAFLSAECQKSRLHLLHCCLQHWSWSLSASSFCFFFFWNFWLPYSEAPEREKFSFSVQRSIYVLEQRAFFFFFSIKQMLHFIWKQCWLFSCAHSPDWRTDIPGTLLTTVWGLQSLPLPGGASHEPPQQAGEMPSSSSSHLVKAGVWIAGACGKPRRLWGRRNSSILPPPPPQVFGKSLPLPFWQQHRSLFGCFSVSHDPTCWWGLAGGDTRQAGQSWLPMAIHNFGYMQPSLSSSTWLLGSSLAQAAETGVCIQEAGDGYTNPTTVGALSNCCQKSQHLWGKASDCHRAELHSSEGKAWHQVMATSDVLLKDR